MNTILSVFSFTKACLLNDEDLKESQFPLAGDMHDLVEFQN